MPNFIQQKHNLNAPKVSKLDFIYQEIAKRMFDRLDYIKITPDTILDIGSGLGIDAKLLKSKFTKTSIIELDLSINILKQYQTKQGILKRLFANEMKHICADAVALPIRSQSVNLVWSNLCLPYIGDMEAYFKEIRRVLTLGGLFLVTGFGVDSLQQLRDVGLNTYNFPDMHIIGDILVKLGFSHPVTDLEYITLEYDSVDQLLSDIRIVGCGGAVKNCRSRLSKIQYNDLSNRFNQITKNGKIPLTLEVFYAHGWKDNVSLDLPDNKKIIQFHHKGS
jgi:malonyl-CoA O-methyltransferase